MGPAVDKELERIMAAADEIGVRLEIVSGMPYWEMHPGFRHQKLARRIADSVAGGTQKDDCACISALDVGIRFPDGSTKRPDVSVFCREPDEQDGLVRLLPESVIEVISPGYEAKDMEIGPTFYLSQGVRDVIVCDPLLAVVHHFRDKKVDTISAPVSLTLLCGCTVHVPS